MITQTKYTIETRKEEFWVRDENGELKTIEPTKYKANAWIKKRLEKKTKSKFTINKDIIMKDINNLFVGEEK